MGCGLWGVGDGKGGKGAGRQGGRMCWAEGEEGERDEVREEGKDKGAWEGEKRTRGRPYGMGLWGVIGGKG